MLDFLKFVFFFLWQNTFYYLFDLFIVIAFVLYILVEVSQKTRSVFVHFLSSFFAIFLGLVFYTNFLPILKTILPPMTANSLSFLFLSLFLYVLFTTLLSRLSYLNIPEQKIVNLVFSFFSFIFLFSFVVYVFVSLPVENLLKAGISRSFVGKHLLFFAQNTELVAKNIVGRDTRETLAVTLLPFPSNRVIKTGFSINGPSQDLLQEKDLVTKINLIRSQNNIPELRISPNLSSNAFFFANIMLKEGYISHILLRDNNTKTGLNLYDRLEIMNIDYAYAYEIVGFGQSTDLLLQLATKDEETRKNILDPRFTKIGIGVFVAQNYGNLYVIILTD